MKWLPKVGEKLYNKYNFKFNLKRVTFLMRITNKEKLKMSKEHIIEKKSLSHISERYGNYDIIGHTNIPYVFCVSSCFPIIDKYIEREYIVNGKHLVICEYSTSNGRLLIVTEQIDK